MPQCIGPNLGMHHFVTEMCAHGHISVTKWCMVGYGTGALWDLCNMPIAELIEYLVEYSLVTIVLSLQWRHNERHGVSNHQPHDFYSTVYSGADQRKHQSSASLAHRWPVNSPHKGPVTRKCFHLMTSSCFIFSWPAHFIWFTCSFRL